MSLGCASAAGAEGPQRLRSMAAAPNVGAAVRDSHDFEALRERPQRRQMSNRAPATPHLKTDYPTLIDAMRRFFRC